MRKSFQIWDHFFPLLFSKNSENLKSFDIGLWEEDAKRPLNLVRNTNTKKILLSKAIYPKNKIFLHGDFPPLLVKILKSETTSFHYFSPKDSESLENNGQPTLAYMSKVS